jgi:hypothetical protein
LSFDPHHADFAWSTALPRPSCNPQLAGKAASPAAGDDVEQAGLAAIEHGLALASREVTGWRAYNFEVAGTHTYIAGGLRVHNTSIGDEIDRLAFENPEVFGFNRRRGPCTVARLRPKIHQDNFEIRAQAA